MHLPNLDLRCSSTAQIVPCLPLTFTLLSLNANHRSRLQVAYYLVYLVFVYSLFFCLSFSDSLTPHFGGFRQAENNLGTTDVKLYNSQFVVTILICIKFASIIVLSTETAVRKMPCPMPSLIQGTKANYLISNWQYRLGWISMPEH